MRIASRVRSDATAPTFIGATDPFASIRTVGPTLITPGSGGGPSVGPITRVSTPISRSARARPST
ncbi:unannotated protein [freshwater metagenome]|uniref:Unannotated protein n=1 Tax=freshwater metagenome TaxID=449393 RepID=A0A6J6X231_9ZZZZ